MPTEWAPDSEGIMDERPQWEECLAIDPQAEARLHTPSIMSWAIAKA